MSFLCKLKTFFFRTSKDKYKGTAALWVSDNERLSRFIFSDKHFSKSKNQVKAAAFMPPNPPRRLALSVYRSGSLSENQVWNIGRKYVEKVRTDDKKIQARADIDVKVVRQATLEVISKPDPHPLHADIIGWTLEESGKKMQANDANIDRQNVEKMREK